jgi:hypothetical protein
MKTRFICLIVGLLCGLLALTAFPPKVTPLNYRSGSPAIEEIRVPELLAQLRHPLAPVGSALRWRLLIPTVGHALKLTPTVYFCLPYLAVFALMAAVCWYSFRLSRSWLTAALVTSLVSTSSIFHVSTNWIGQMDAFYVLALTVLTFTPSLPLAALCCAVGPWIDERFLLIAPAYLVIRLIRTDNLPRLMAVAAPLAGYVLVRASALLFLHGDSTVMEQINSQLGNLKAYAPFIPAGWWWAFRGGWFAIILGLAAILAAAPRSQRWLLLLALSASVIAISFLAWDTSRNAAVLVPFIVLGSPILKRMPATVLAVANLIFPAAYVVFNATVFLSH